MVNHYNPYQPFQPGTYQPQYPTQTQIYQQPSQTSAQMPVSGQTQQVQQQPQNGGFISVPSEEIVKTYPVAPGNCVTFKIEGQPIVMEKSMGFSQLEAPKIERYRLVKEERIESVPEPTEEVPQSVKELKSEIRSIWKEIENIKARKNPPMKKKEATDDDTD